MHLLKEKPDQGNHVFLLIFLMFVTIRWPSKTNILIIPLYKWKRRLEIVFCWEIICEFKTCHKFLLGQNSIRNPYRFRNHKIFLGSSMLKKPWMVNLNNGKQKFYGSQTFN